MQCKLSSRTTFKPQLEELEERANPSFLLGGNTVQQMAQPLNAIVTDMKAVANDLTGNLQVGNNAPNGSTLQGRAFITAVSDFQRLLTEQKAVQATSAADQQFINAVAMVEFQSGDATDLAVLYFGPKFLNLYALKPLTDVVDQANSIMGGQDVKNDINLMHVDSYNGLKLSQYTATPNF